MSSEAKYKIFGVGMSKTGTTTLARCFEILGLGPHKSYDYQLKHKLLEEKNLDYVLAQADNYRTFEDSPWYHIYRELDQRYPGSKFILTVRKDSLTHAKSSWAHGVRRGLRSGGIDPKYLEEKVRIYEEHNNGVLEYFKDRPNDLLVLCWENGDGWEKLCSFLEVPVPKDQPIPHSNQGRYRSPLPRSISESGPYNAVLRGAHWLWLNTPVRKVKNLFVGRPSL